MANCNGKEIIHCNSTIEYDIKNPGYNDITHSSACRKQYILGVFKEVCYKTCISDILVHANE